MTYTALLCVALAYVVVKWLNELFDGDMPSKLKIPLAVVVGIGVVFLVGESDWASSQEFLGITLDAMREGSKVIAGVLLGAAAVGVDTGLKTVRNIGENDTTP